VEYVLDGFLDYFPVEMIITQREVEVGNVFVGLEDVKSDCVQDSEFNTLLLKNKRERERCTTNVKKSPGIPS